MGGESRVTIEVEKLSHKPRMNTLRAKLKTLGASVLFTLHLFAQPDSTQHSPHSDAFVTTNGVKLHYLDWGGKGDALLLLHGMGDTAHVYDDFAPRFTNEFRVLGLTRRGHGGSEVPETGYDTATLVEDIRQFLDALKIERVILAGHSFAGDELTRFAVVHPDRVIKLIYFDSAYDHSRVPESLRFKPLHGWGGELFPTKEESASREGQRRWISRLFGEKRGPAMYSMMEGAYSARAEYDKIKARALAFFAVGYQKDVDQAQRLPAPQRQNVRDFLKAQREYHEQEIEHFRKEVPNGRVVVLTNASHTLFIDREDEVCREIREFLGGAEWTDKSPHKAGFITVNNVKLHYLDWGGQGETMLFLHGAGDTPHIYDDLAPKFTNQFRVLGLTRRGHGESEKPESGYDTATRIEDILHFMDAMKIPRAILVGHSAAGNEVSLFAVTHPERATKVVYLDALFYVDGHLKLLERYPPELFRSKANGDTLDSWRRWYQRMNSGWSEAVEANARANFTLRDPEKRARALRLMIENEARPDHTKIKSPALMITVINPGAHAVQQLGTLSEQRLKEIDNFLSECRQMKQKEIELFRAAIPNGRVVTLTNADHHCFIDRQEDVLREMRAFLAPAQMSLPLPIDVEIPAPPTPVKADGKWWLVYELHVTNFHTNNVELVRVEVLDEAKRPVATYTDEELSRRIAPATSIRLPLPDRPERVIGPAMRAVIYLLLTAEHEADVPSALIHRLVFKGESAVGNSEDMIEGGQVTVSRKKPPVLGPPLRGEGWVASRGPSNDSIHRRASVVVGKARIPQRFAIDFWRIDSDGSPVSSPHRYVGGGLDFETRDDAKNANWHAHGAEVLAVGNAIVADVKDGIPENEMGSGEKAVPITFETVAGNYVILHLGNNNFALYAHLQPKSIRVHVGQKVHRGQVLALLGNSGHSDAPHLHFQVMDGNSVVSAEGMPYVFDSFEVQGVLPSAELGTWKPPSTAKADKRRREIPTENAVVRFP
jgi:pimeloyl-ACP methyl ester carboxylesterase/murein DD-endopeptidase MepM/ murein hydrolase activator NlpD